MTIKSSLLRNGYPDRFVNDACKAFNEENIINNENFRTQQQSQTSSRPEQLPEVYVCVPYVGKPSLKLQFRIRKEMQEHRIKTIAAYKTTKVGSYFNLKSSCPHLFHSNVVYQFSCFRDVSSTYIGETRRQLFQRVDDHRGKDKKSAVFDHLYKCDSCQSLQNLGSQFSILQKCNKRSILSYEALLIARNCPKLNTQLGPGKGTMVSLSLYN